MTVHPDVLSFYGLVTGCTAATERCPGIVRDLPAGIPPRGFYTEASPGEAKLLLVAKNPGHVIEGETLLYAARPPLEIARTHFAWAHRCFYENDSFDAKSRRSLTFHRNILDYVSFLLGVAKHEVFRHCAYTNLVKCETVGEQDPLHPATMSECFARHFLAEIRLLRPRVLLGLGREPCNFLLAHASEHGLPVLYVKHPSYHYRRDLKAGALEALKGAIHEALNRPPPGT